MKKFKPHMMYDPKTGKGYKAKKPEDHVRMDKMGYTHDKPKEAKEDTTTASIPNPAQTSMGPSKFLDRRSKKKLKPLKAFRDYYAEKGIGQ